MKADISDAPERVSRRHHKRGVFFMVICLILGSTVTIGALQAIYRASSINETYTQSMSQLGEEGELIRATGMPPNHEPQASLTQSSSDIYLPADTARQTVFNDQNFIARGADTVLTFRVGPEPSPSPKKEIPKSLKLTIVGQPPHMKDQACQPYKQGSIESRNCRTWIGLRHRY